MLINSGTSRSIVLHGNIHDLFYVQDGVDEDYIPLVPFLTQSWDISGFILVVYELNGPLRFLRASDREKVKNAFNTWRGDTEPSKSKTTSLFALPVRLDDSDPKAGKSADTSDGFV